MKIKFLMVLPTFLLSGCVGLTYSGNSELKSTDVVDQIDLRYRAQKPSQLPVVKSEDGSETYVIKDEREWCGPTVMAVIPIPLWLPVCRNYQEVTYKNEKIVNVKSQRPTFFAAYCGPLVPFFGFWGARFDFCLNESSK